MTTALLDPVIARADLADRALLSAAELPADVRADLAAVPMTAVTLVLSQGIPTDSAGWARLERILLIVACKDTSLLDDALELLG